MRFLSVAERDLRAAARQKATYRVRWITAAAFLGLFVWMMWALHGFNRKGVGSDIFEVFSVITFLYCVFIGATRTADCLSSEKREGTLGLLFLTNLNSAEIVAGKLCSSGLAAVYGLLAAFPILALPVLLGGVTFDYFWKTVLALLNAIFFSMAAGFVASAVSVRQFTAVALAGGLVLLFSVGMAGTAQAVKFFGGPNASVEAIAVFSPIYSMSVAKGSRLYGQNRYWLSLVAVQALSWTWLALVAWWLARTWRDRPKAVRSWSGFRVGPRGRSSGGAGRTAFRRRLLGINPFFWLASRQRVSAPVFMGIVIVLVSITSFVVAPYFGRTLMGGPAMPYGGHVFAWLWAVLAIHGLVLYHAGAAAAQRLAEDKQTGALELILSTPLTERSISRGLWLAYVRRLFFPALVALLVHSFFIWQVLTLMVLDPPGNLPPGATAGQIFRSSVFGVPLNGQVLEWEFGMIMRGLLLVLLALMASWVTLGWVGRWLGLRLKHAGLAPMIAVALLLLPPVLLFSLVCYVFDKMGVGHMPQRHFIPLMMWIAFGIGTTHCCLLSYWAARRLRRDFRATVTSRFQPPTRRRWIPSPRAVLRFAVRSAVATLALVLVVVGLYGCQNWRSQRAWVVFQRELKQRGESLDLAALLPGSVPDAQNFVRSPAFQNVLTRNAADAPAAQLFDALGRLQSQLPGALNWPVGTEWTKQRLGPLDRYLKLIQPGVRAATDTNRQQMAAIALEALQPLDVPLRALAEAAHLPFFQPATKPGAPVFLQPNEIQTSMPERVQYLFQLRTSALLAVDRPADAAEDLLTSLRLARLARQALDAGASLRVQAMLIHSLQPLWEGLAERRWTESQLAAIQAELAQFNLLADHTNAIHRVVSAYIELWRSASEAGMAYREAAASGGGFTPSVSQQLQPRFWWMDNSIHLYKAGQNAIAQVDVAGGHLRVSNMGIDWGDLPLGSEAYQLFEQGQWYGADDSVTFAQTALNQAILACALERHRLTNGTYPESLGLLVPVYLDHVPHDVVSGRPMIYQRMDDGSFILRSVGPNETNDQKNPSASDDWLWKYPTNAPPAGVTAPMGR